MPMIGILEGEAESCPLNTRELLALRPPCDRGSVLTGHVENRLWRKNARGRTSLSREYSLCLTSTDV